MSTNDTVAYINDYANIVQLLSQQQMSRLRAAVTVGSYSGKDAKVVEQFGSVRATERTSRHQPVTYVDTPQTARWLQPKDYFIAEAIDNIDQIRSGIDLAAPIARAHAAAFARKEDDIIMGAFYATARTGEDGAGSQAFDTNMVVGIDEGGTDSGLNVAKLRKAQELLMARDVDLSTNPLYCVVSSVQLTQLRREIEIAGSEYNLKPTLNAQGMITGYAGINFIHVEFTRNRDGSNMFANSGSMIDGNNDHRIPVFTRNAIVFGQWDGIKAEYARRYDTVSSSQLLMTMSGAATRVDEDQIVEIKCNPAA